VITHQLQGAEEDEGAPAAAAAHRARAERPGAGSGRAGLGGEHRDRGAADRITGIPFLLFGSGYSPPPPPPPRPLPKIVRIFKK